jgi:hypothetical protein
MKIDFQFNTDYGVFSDSLDLPDDQTFADSDIEAMKQQRLSDWLALVTPPDSQSDSISSDSVSVE